MEFEFFDLRKCPMCPSSHRFKLAVERDVVIKVITFPHESELPRKVRFTRFFVCPVTNLEFQATFELTETARDRIINVQVKGAAHD